MFPEDVDLAGDRARSTSNEHHTETFLDQEFDQHKFGKIYLQSIPLRSPERVRCPVGLKQTHS